MGAFTRIRSLFQAVIAGVLIPGARRRDRARGGGTYGGDGRRD